MGLFDVVGPVMIGPSSSHTAGAARLAKMARRILGETVARADLYLYGSFAQTYRGHGTDKALAAGLQDFAADDIRLREALQLAEHSGLQIRFHTIADAGSWHPNTVRFVLQGIHGGMAEVVGASVGGGEIVISHINGYEVEVNGKYYTLIASYQDKPGVIAQVSQLLAQHEVNIAFMKVSRRKKGEDALMLIQTDQEIADHVLTAVTGLAVVDQALLVKPL